MGNKKKFSTKEFVGELSKQSREFCIVGLTGKVRSGTSDVCKLLKNPSFPMLMDLPSIYQEKSKEDTREYRIIYRYLRENWKPFVELNVTSVIISYLLDLKPEDLQSLSIQSTDTNKSIGASISDALKNCIAPEQGRKKFTEDIKENVLSVDSALACDLPKEKRDTRKDSLISLCDNLSIQKAEDFFHEWDSAKKYLDTLNRTRQDDSLNGQEQNASTKFFKVFVFCFGVLPALEAALRNEFKKLGDDDQLPIAFQNFGNNIRATGTVAGISGDDTTTINSKNLFALPSRINCLIKLLRSYPLEQSVEKRSPVYVVINNFKNIFEAYYFKRRYAAFYLLAVACDETKRREKFFTWEKYYLTNLREDLSSGKKIFKMAEEKKFDQQKIREVSNKSSDEDKAKQEFALQISDPNNCLRRISYQQNLAPFILQDVVTCIENADIFVTRDYNEALGQYDQQLIRMLGRIVTLILHPGLLTPTRIERCMQIAMTAKLNSGCLSRQVGAVVTDQNYNILSLGWNDAPCGAESCLRRNFFDLARKSDKQAYSQYELENEEFRDYIDTVKQQLNPRMEELKGLPLAFCFKDIYQSIIQQRDQIYTRALHGEERALAACDNSRARGGYLFTTSSPCELCAKRAKEMGISKIYYIEQYPGISRTHVMYTGPKVTQAQYEFFVGAVGLAYIKLYTPLIPYKDELAALNFSPSDTYKKLTSPPPSGESGEDKNEEDKNDNVDKDASQDLFDQSYQPGQPCQPK